MQKLPVLRIEVRPDGEATNVNALAITNLFDERKVTQKFRVDEVRQHLLSVIEAFRRAVPLQPTQQQAADALRLLQQQLSGTAAQVFGLAGLAVIGDVLRKACRPGPNRSPPLIVVDSSLDDFLPVEVFPLQNLVAGDDVSLEQLANRFAGFCCVVQREVPDAPGPHPEIMEASRPRIRFFCDSTLAGARKESAFFEANGNVLTVKGPWPPSGLAGKKFAAELARLLWHAADSQTRGKNVQDQIQHFACHCEISDVLSFYSALRMSRDNQCQASILELKGAFATLFLSGGPRQNPGPLVFMNACESSLVLPMASSSFPSLFIGDREPMFHNLGFIGTEANLPDTFAAEFAESFYLHFLRDGLDLGNAMHQAKWKMLEEHRNPLGLLYSVFASPRLHVTECVAGLQPAGQRLGRRRRKK